MNGKQKIDFNAKILPGNESLVTDDGEMVFDEEDEIFIQWNLQIVRHVGIYADGMNSVKI